MVRSLWTAATGMQAQQMNIDNMSNNLANVNTHGFKKGRVLFQDLLYQDIKSAGAVTAAGINHPSGIQMGMGVATVAIQKIHSQGNYDNTYNELDLTIEGDGYFQLTLPDGNIGYIRSGAFSIDANGDVVSPEGYLLEPGINIPDNALRISVSSDGIFSVKLPGEDEETELGQIEIARFINPTGLASIGENIYLATGASGAAQVGIPSEDGYGKVKQHFLETSNVQMVTEMVNMITGQRAYEMTFVFSIADHTIVLSILIVWNGYSIIVAVLENPVP